MVLYIVEPDYTNGTPAERLIRLTRRRAKRFSRAFHTKEKDWKNVSSKRESFTLATKSTIGRIRYICLTAHAAIAAFNWLTCSFRGETGAETGYIDRVKMYYHREEDGVDDTIQHFVVYAARTHKLHVRLSHQ